MNFVDPSWFHNERSYKAFMWAAEVTRKLEELRLKGAMIFDGDELISSQAEWIVVLDGVNSFTGYRHDNYTQMFYGGSHDCESSKAWATMKDIKSNYADVRVVMPKDAKTIKDLMK